MSRRTGSGSGPSTKTADGRRLRGAFPQVRLLALAECGTRALVAAVHGAYSTGEKTLARDLIGRLGEGMLCLADPNFACWELWRDAAATGAQLLWRIGASFTLPVDEVLPDRTYLSRLKAPRKLRKDGAADITVRVVEYRLEDEHGEVSETFTLITSLLDPVAAPARELAELYKARWEIETALGSLKTQVKGSGVVLRSKTPNGVVQEIWALLCAYHAVRDLTAAAAALARQDPLRISFASALDVVRGPVGQPGPFPPDRLARLVTASLGVIAAVAGRQRPARSHPRQAKRSTSYPARPADPDKRPKPRGPLTLVMLPITVRGDT